MQERGHTMAFEPERRVKVTDGAKHRVGTIRAAVKPHKAATTSAKQVIADYLQGLGKGSLQQSYTGDTLNKNAKLIRTSFGVGGAEELYLLCDPTGSGKVGLLLSASGVHTADGRGGASHTPWKDFPKTDVSSQRGMVVIGQTGVKTNDAKVLVTLLQKLQATAAQ